MAIGSRRNSNRDGETTRRSARGRSRQRRAILTMALLTMAIITVEQTKARETCPWADAWAHRATGGKHEVMCPTVRTVTGAGGGSTGAPPTAATHWWRQRRWRGDARTRRGRGTAVGRVYAARPSAGRAWHPRARRSLACQHGQRGRARGPVLMRHSPPQRPARLLRAARLGPRGAPSPLGCQEAAVAARWCLPIAAGIAALDRTGPR